MSSIRYPQTLPCSEALHRKAAVLRDVGCGGSGRVPARTQRASRRHRNVADRRRNYPLKGLTEILSMFGAYRERSGTSHWSEA